MEIVLPEFKELSFVENTHTYLLDGVAIPSVSKIMEPLRVAQYAGVNEQTLNRAADKGTAVHNSIENWLLFGIEDVPPEHKGYFDAFRLWWDDAKPEVVGTEVRVYHKLLRYGGTGDLLVIVDGELCLFDYKTTYALNEMLCRVQLEAYSQAFASHGIITQGYHVRNIKEFGLARPPQSWQYVDSDLY